MGILITKMYLQDIASTKAPPIIGPKALAAPATAPHIPSASPLCFCPNSTLRIESVAGSMAAPPMACIPLETSKKA